MSLIKKYQLTDLYWLEVCSRFDKDALNGEKFKAENDWAIEERLGENQSPVYTTKAAIKFNIKIKSISPAHAVQQIVSYAYTGQEKKLKNMWFKIVKQ